MSGRPGRQAAGNAERDAAEQAVMRRAKLRWLSWLDGERRVAGTGFGAWWDADGKLLDAGSSISVPRPVLNRLFQAAGDPAADLAEALRPFQVIGPHMALEWLLQGCGALPTGESLADLMENPAALRAALVVAGACTAHQGPTDNMHARAWVCEAASAWLRPAAGHQAGIGEPPGVSPHARFIVALLQFQDADEVPPRVPQVSAATARRIVHEWRALPDVAASLAAAEGS